MRLKINRGFAALKKEGREEEIKQIAAKGGRAKKTYRGKIKRTRE